VPIDEYDGSSETLVAPVLLSGQPIGTLQLHKMDSEDTSQLWTEQDLEFVETILDQVAQTAENLRLFDETQERAAQEATIREITDKLRAAPNMDSLLETAARELGNRLGVQRTRLEFGIESDNNPAGNGDQP
jgi:GAF domain-containing protein